MSAPSGVNKQPWEFIVVDDCELLSQLADALPYAKMTADAPVAIVVCGNRERFLDGVDDVLWEQDLSAASENILLASHAIGLGGVWTCIYPHEERISPVKSILNLPDNLIPFNLIPIGYPAKEHAPMDKWHSERECTKTALKIKNIGYNDRAIRKITDGSFLLWHCVFYCIALCILLYGIMYFIMSSHAPYICSQLIL